VALEAGLLLRIKAAETRFFQRTWVICVWADLAGI
jgi:hypothetical protein